MKKRASKKIWIRASKDHFSGDWEAMTPKMFPSGQFEWVTSEKVWFDDKLWEEEWATSEKAWFDDQ